MYWLRRTTAGQPRWPVLTVISSTLRSVPHPVRKVNGQVQLAHRWATTLSTARATAAVVSASEEVTSARQTPLRPYQHECIEQCLRLFQEGKQRQVVSLPVGSGKTVIFSNLIASIPPPTPRATRALVLAHREELLLQAARQISRFAPQLRVAIDQGTRQAIPSTVDVVVASVPSLGRKGTQRLEKYDPDEFKCIIIDEAHHAAAASYQRILDYFGVARTIDKQTAPKDIGASDLDETAAAEVSLGIDKSPNDIALNTEELRNKSIFVWGCSATVRRHDRVRLDCAFDYIAYHKEFMEMIEEGWLTNLRVTTVETQVDISKVKSLGGDFSLQQLARAVNSPERNELVVRSYLQYAAGRQSSLVFAVDIQHVKDLTAAFRARGIDARFLTSETPSDERADLIDAFRAREFPVIVNCGILTEGTDIPNIDCLLMARPTRSSVLFQQMIGRGMRLFDGKTDCLTLDFVDSMKRQGLTTVPTLVGLDERVVLKDKEVTETLKEMREQSSAEAAQHDSSVLDNINLIKSVTVTEYTSLQDITAGKQESVIRKLSRFNWLYFGPDIYSISLPDATVKVDREQNAWRVQYRIKLDAHNKPVRPEANADAKAGRVEIDKHAPARGRSHNGFTRYYELKDLELNSLAEAVHAADQWIKARGGFVRSRVEWRASWRSTPASPAQLAILEKRGILSSLKEARQTSHHANGNALPEVQIGWTRGQAADMLTRLFEGGMAAWRKQQHELEVTARRQVREQAKLQAQRDALRVEVGPFTMPASAVASH